MDGLLSAVAVVNLVLVLLGSAGWKKVQLVLVSAVCIFNYTIDDIIFTYKGTPPCTVYISSHFTVHDSRPCRSRQQLLLLPQRLSTFSLVS